MADKLTKQDIESIINHCNQAIVDIHCLPHETHANKVIQLVILGLKTKAERKICGLTKPSYSFKISAMELEALYCVRNELMLNMLHAHSISKLLILNKKK